MQLKDFRSYGLQNVLIVSARQKKPVSKSSPTSSLQPYSLLNIIGGINLSVR